MADQQQKEGMVTGEELLMIIAEKEVENRRLKKQVEYLMQRNLALIESGKKDGKSKNQKST